MADTTSTAPVSADPVHQEGIEHIKENIGDTSVVATSAGSTEPVAPAAEPAPATTESAAAEPTPAAASHTETSPAAAGAVAPIEPAKPPASNPGADDPAAGIAKDAGGTSNTAHIESPVQPTETAPAATPTTQKRKSVIGTFKGFLGLNETSEEKKERKKSLADRSKSTSSTAAAAETKTTTDAGGAPGDTAKDSTAAEAAATADDNKVADPTTDASVPGTETADAPAEAETAGEGEAKGGKAAEHKSLENRGAIPEAGGEKLGEQHWGESKVIPADPKPKEEGVASAAGQPDSETKDNTAKNTGSAAAPEKKEKLLDRVKDKLKLGKKDK